MTAGPLAGTTVLDLSTVGPAARCARLLADYGAAVVKVAAPPRPGSVLFELAHHTYSGHRGMQRVQIDVRSDAGRAAFLRLAATVDVVIESFRPGVVDRLGIGESAVRAVNPGVVYCSTSGYGQTGPAAQRAGHDINYLAVGGYLHTSGRVGTAPPGPAATDSAGPATDSARSASSASGTETTAAGATATGAAAAGATATGAAAQAGATDFAGPATDSARSASGTETTAAGATAATATAAGATATGATVAAATATGSVATGVTTDGAPALPGATIADIAAGGMHAAAAILAALVARARTGEGAYLDVSVADGVAWMLSLYIDEFLATGDVPGPGHNILTGRYACYGIYGTRDGRWLAVGAIEPVFWANLCRALGLERWIAHQTDDAVQDAIRTDLAAAFVARDRDEWVARLADSDTCVTPVNDIGDMVADAQFAARGAFVEARHPVHGTFRQLAPVLAGAPRQAAYDLPDMSTTQTDAVLAAAGFTPGEIAELHAAGAVA